MLANHKSMHIPYTANNSRSSAAVTTSALVEQKQRITAVFTVTHAWTAHPPVWLVTRVPDELIVVRILVCLRTGQHQTSNARSFTDQKVVCKCLQKLAQCQM